MTRTLKTAIMCCLGLLLPLASGCSWIGMRTVPKGYHPSQELECSGCTAPVVDGIVSGVLMLGGMTFIALAGGSSSEGDGGPWDDAGKSIETGAVVLAGGMIIVGAVYMVSAITGYSKVGECKKARVAREAWQEMSPEHRKLEVFQLCEPLLSGQTQGFGPRRNTTLPKECEELQERRMAYWRSVDLEERDPGTDRAADGDDGGTPLHRAAFWGYVEAVKVLLDRGAEVNAENQSGLSPLYLAIIQGHAAVVEVLVKGGAEINTRMPSGVTPFYFAFINGRKEIAKFLIANGADVNARPESGETLLHWSARNGFTDAAELLVNNGADPTIKDKIGWTPLMHAEHNGNRETIEYLKKVSGGSE